MNFTRVIRNDLHLLAVLAGIFAAIAAVMAFLFAYPFASWALGFALPFLVLLLTGVVLLAMNLRWSLWHGRRPFFFALADYGFLACFAAFAVYSTASVVANAASLPWVLGGLVFLSVLRVAFIEFEAWGMGLLFAALLMVVLGPYVRFTLLHPEWFFDFTAAFLLLGGILLIGGGSAASLLRLRRHERRLPARLPARLALGGAVAAVALGAVSAGLTLASREQAPADVRPDGVLAFSGGHLRWVRSGGPEVLIRNNDPLVHTLTVREVFRTCHRDWLGREICDTTYSEPVYDFVLGPGSERLVTLAFGPGRYELRCRVPGQTVRPLHVGG